MFRHVFAYRLKYLLRNRVTVFWTLLFPMTLSVFFTLAFSNIYHTEAFTRIPVAVADSPAYQADAALKSALAAVSTGEDPLFTLQVTSLAEAKALLASGSITGYLDSQGGLHAVVSDSGIQQTILKSFLDTYLQANATAKHLIALNPTAILSGLMADLQKQQEYTAPLPGMPEPETLLAYYYALLAMACMYGSFWGLQEINDIQANLSPQGARVSAAPVHKLKTFLAGLSAAMIIQYAQLLLLMAFMHFVLGVNFGNQTGYVLLLGLVGNLMGVSFGAALAASGRRSENTNVGILISVSMFLSFFSGLMFAEIKYTVAKAFPLAQFINPAALVADGFYALYYYQGHGRYWLNIGLLTAFSVLNCLMIYRAIRRRKYASL